MLKSSSQKSKIGASISISGCLKHFDYIKLSSSLIAGAVILNAVSGFLIIKSSQTGVCLLLSGVAILFLGLSLVNSGGRCKYCNKSKILIQKNQNLSRNLLFRTGLRLAAVLVLTYLAILVLLPGALKIVCLTAFTMLCGLSIFFWGNRSKTIEHFRRIYLINNRDFEAENNIDELDKITSLALSIGNIEVADLTSETLLKKLSEAEKVVEPHSPTTSLQEN